MGAHATIDVNDIVSAAIQIVREAGWDAVSARRIAGRLGCSTMPIYSGAGSMQDLRTLTKARAVEMLETSQRIPRTGNPALDLAVGYVAFAREEPKLFHFVLSEDGSPRPPSPEESMRAGRERLIDDAPKMGGILDSILKSVQGDFLFRSWIFTHGLAELVASGVVEMSDEEILRHLNAAGAAFYAFHSQEGKA